MTCEYNGVNFYFNVIKKDSGETLISSSIYDGDSNYAMRAMKKESFFWENLGYEVKFCETRKVSLISDKTLETMRRKWVREVADSRIEK